MPPLPDLVLYARPGCSLCDEARDAIRVILHDRQERGLAVPNVVERNIEDDPNLHRRYLERIPVIELGEQRVELIVTVGKLRRLLRALDGDDESITAGTRAAGDGIAASERPERGWS